MTLRGTRFGKYNLLKRIAVGGMAEIFWRGKKALKALRNDLYQTDPPPSFESANFVNMFLNKTKTSGTFEPPQHRSNLRSWSNQ